MPTTDNHEFSTPADGEKNFAETFEQFFSQIDATAEIRDTDANRSNYEPKVDAKFYATNTHDIYIGDGTSWVKVPTSGKNPTFDSVSTDELSITEQSAKIYQTTGQTISNDTLTTIEMDSDDPDFSPGSVLTVDLTNNRVTIEKTGLYEIATSIGFLSPGDGTRVIARPAVGSVNPNQQELATGANKGFTLTPTTIVEITSPPVNVTLEVYQDSGGTIDTHGQEKRGHLKVARLG